MAQLIKNPPARWETWVASLGCIPGLGRFPWRKERLPTPVFWPGEYHGLYSPWGCKKSDTTEQVSLSLLPSNKHLREIGIAFTGLLS